MTGITEHELSCLDIATRTTLIKTNYGRIVLIMQEYTYYGRGNTIHSPGKIEWFHDKCDDKFYNVGGKQVILFIEGYATPYNVDLVSCI